MIAGWSGGRRGRSSPLFDPAWYLAGNPDVRSARVDPFKHYLTRGWREGRRPHPLFDPAFYLAENTDVAGAGLEPLQHYLEHGWREGRRPHPLFDPAWYLSENADVVAADIDPLQHYLAHGWHEGRAPHPLFDPAFYLDRNADVRTAGIEPLGHYLAHGGREGRRPHPLFDPDWYGRTYPETATAANPLQDYLCEGWKRGRWPNPLFDPDWYLATHADVARAGWEPLTHYAGHGWREGRQPNAVFDLDFYRKKAGLKATGSDPLAHYLLEGSRTVRQPCRPIDLDYYRTVNPDLAGLPNVAALNHFLHRGQREGRLARPPSIRLKSATPAAARPARRGGPAATVRSGEPLVIAGFHRSGTSMTANLLHDAGLFLGDRLLGANETNRMGHFEDVEVVKFHEALLARDGRTWQVEAEFLPSFSAAEWDWMARFGAMRSVNPTWGFKDPRVCLFLPQWARVFPDMRVLYVFRPCVECVSSLKRRAAADLRRNHDVARNRRFWETPDLGIRIYLSYALMALRFLDHFEGHYRVVELADVVDGLDLVGELKRHWGYDLFDVEVSDVYDAAEMSSAGPNEIVFDEGLVEHVEAVEARLRAHAARGFVGPAQRPPAEAARVEAMVA